LIIDIEKLNSFEFALRSKTLSLSVEKKQYILSKQLLHSGTPIEAKIRKSENTVEQIRFYFINFLQILHNFHPKSY